MATIRPHWSYSAITQYLRCPQQYFFQRVLGLPSHSIGTGLALGSAVHAGLAEYHQRLQRKEAVDTEAVLKAFHECWDEKELNETIQYRDGDTREDSIEQGVHLLELYLKEPPPEGIVAVEQRILVPLYNSQGEYLETPLVEITDLITETNDDLTVREFKTSGRAYSESDVASSLQPTCYVHVGNARVGLRENGWFTEDVLFDLPPRDFVLILLTPTSGNPLVQEYRDTDQLRAAIPHAERLKDLPCSPFIGELSYRSVIDILAEQQRWFSLPERRLIGELNEYLQFKLSQLRTSNGHGHG